jgi:RNA polymerase sigma-70 factor (ECF subfamily)
MLDSARFTALFSTHAPTLLLYARQLNSDPEDVVQEAFIRLLSQTVEPREVRPWLLRTVRNLAIDRRRAWFRLRRREATVPRTSWFMPTEDSALDAAHAASLLAALPQRQREVLVLKIWNDQSLAQIASLLGLAPSTVHADLHAALNTLKQKLEPHHARR